MFSAFIAKQKALKKVNENQGAKIANDVKKR